MDESFLPISDIIEKLTAIEGEIFSGDNGIRSYIYEFEIGTPVELDILWNEDGKLQIGSVPPLYRINTSFRPSYHNITLTVEKTL